MKGVVKYFFRTHFLVVSGIISIYALGAIFLNILFPSEVIDGHTISSGQFSGFYAGFPMMCVVMQAVMALQCGGVNLNVALSMGARRRDYLIVMHVFMLLETIISLILIHGLYVLNEKAHLLGRFSEYFYSPDKFWLMVMFLVSSQLTGLGCMLLGNKNQVIGSILTGLLTMVIIMGFAFIMVASDSLYLWGDLPAIIFAAMIIISVVGEVSYLRYMKKAVVR